VLEWEREPDDDHNAAGHIHTFENSREARLFSSGSAPAAVSAARQRARQRKKSRLAAIIVTRTDAGIVLDDDVPFECGEAPNQNHLHEFVATIHHKNYTLHE
jgi:hypothetical protein